MEQEQAVLPTENQTTEPQVEETVQEAEEGTGETKTVKNFWERLDEVFNLSKQTNQNLEDILEQFPDFQRTNAIGKSALFQPERISINSKDALIKSNVIDKKYDEESTVLAQSYSSFRIRFQKPLLNVKSIQLLSGIVPTPTNSFPNNERIFGYYKITDVQTSSSGAWNGAQVTYNTYTIVTYAGNYYYNWRAFTSAGAWFFTTIYNPGDWVTYLGNAYYCLQRNENIAPTSQILNPATSEPYWIPVNNPQTVAPNANSDFWILIGAVGDVDTDPNWLLVGRLSAFHYIEFLDFNFAQPEDYEVPIPAFNRFFQSYGDLVDNLNLGASNAENTDLPGELYFEYVELYNKIRVSPVDQNSTAIYIPSWLNDKTFLDIYGDQYEPMSVRLGFTWDGALPGYYGNGFWGTTNPFTENIADILYDYSFGNNVKNQNYLTFNSYPNIS